MRRIPDKTRERAELAAALARYSGPVTKCPPAAANAPGVSMKELEQALQRKERKRARDADDVASLRILQRR